MSGPDRSAEQIEHVHHIGISVADMERSLGFWSRFLGVVPRSRATIDAEFLGDLVGYPGIILEIAFLDLPGGVALELVRHVTRSEEPLPLGTAHPGATHICLTVASLDRSLSRAVAAGAIVASVSPVEIPSGPNAGARHVYVRDPDGVTIELRQAAPRSQR